MSSAASSLAILQLSDSHLLGAADDTMLGIATEKYFLEVLQLAFAAGQTYDLVLVTGDLAQTPCPTTYQRLAQHLQAYDVPVLCLPGNHDDLPLMQQYLNEQQISCTKQLLFEHWQVICLNTQIVGDAGGYLTDHELAFLEQCLQQYPQHHALIAMHHHCVPTHSAWMDTMIVGNSHDFLALCHRYPQVKGITTGHIHQELYLQTQALQIFGNPSTCFQFTPYSADFSLDNTAPGFRRFALDMDGRITSKVTRLPAPLSELRWDENGYFDGP